jgi:cytochrome P450
MMSFVLCSTLHPDKYQKLCDEIDNNTPSDRLPSFSDLPNLPYLRAFIKENLRWRPVTAGGVPHKITTKDDVYNGYLIKKDSVIHAVQWSIHRDPALYPEPETFLPERWLDPKYPTYSEPLTVYPNLQNYSNFGFGRRICPGQNIAERSLYIEAAMIAWACDIKEVPGKRPPLYDYAAGFNTRPNWFPFELKARKGRGMLVKNEFEKVWGERMKAQ